MNTLNEPTAQTVLGDIPSLACDCSASHKGSREQLVSSIGILVRLPQPQKQADISSNRTTARTVLRGTESQTPSLA